MKKQSILMILISLALILVVAACGATSMPTVSPAGSNPAEGSTSTPANTNQTEAPTEVVIQHDLGETTVSINPEKIVVFDFGVLDTLDKLGIQITGVPQMNIPPYLSQYKDSTYVNVGSLVEPDFEAISEIRPDLIIISGRQSTAYDELKKIGPTVFMGIDNSNYLDSFTNNMTKLGQIFNLEDKISEEVNTIIQAVDTLHATASTKGNALIVLANEGNISAYGPGSRFGIIHGAFGMTPVDSNIEVSTHGMNVSYEYILEKDPDYLFVIDRSAAVGGQSSAQQTLENELIKNTKAYQNGNIVYLNPNYWYLSGGGLVSVSEMINEITEGLK